VDDIEAAIDKLSSGGVRFSISAAVSNSTEVGWLPFGVDAGADTELDEVGSAVIADGITCSEINR
jgi:hypothetical protein